jgi:hypothetical protein
MLANDLPFTTDYWILTPGFFLYALCLVPCTWVDINGQSQRKHSYYPPHTVGSYHCSYPVHLVCRYYLRPDNKDILGCFLPVTAYKSCPSEKRCASSSAIRSEGRGELRSRIPSEFQLKSFLIDATVYGCLEVFLLPFPEKFGGTHEWHRTGTLAKARSTSG